MHEKEKTSLSFVVFFFSSFISSSFARLVNSHQNTRFSLWLERAQTVENNSWNEEKIKEKVRAHGRHPHFTWVPAARERSRSSAGSLGRWKILHIFFFHFLSFLLSLSLSLSLQSSIWLSILIYIIEIFFCFICQMQFFLSFLGQDS